MFDDQTTRDQKHPEFNGVAESDSLNGEVKITVEDDLLRASTLFDDRVILYADIEAFVFQNYTVRVTTNEERITFSKMGQTSEWFYQELEEAYHRKVQGALHARGTCLAEAKGNFSYGDIRGQAKIRVFNDCLMLLPANREGRRLPFVFMKDLQSKNYTLTITMDDGEEYLFTQLGHDLDNLERAIKTGIGDLQVSNTQFIEELDPQSGATLATRAARQYPEGLAANLEDMRQDHPTLAEALEKKVLNSRMRETYPVLQEIGDSSQMSVGCMRLPETEVETLKESLDAAGSGEMDGDTDPVEMTPEQEDALRWIVWLALPARSGQGIIVEFALPQEAAATYVFRSARRFDSFLSILNRALEAGEMQRETILLPEEKLQQDKHADERILIDRTPAMQELRRSFVGRAIHRSIDSWKNSVLKLLEP